MAHGIDLVLPQRVVNPGKLRHLGSLADLDEPRRQLYPGRPSSPSGEAGS